MNQDERLSRLEPQARDELRRLYADLDAAVAVLAPVCVLSGNCCRFKEYGHTLFLSAPEADLLLDEAPPPSRPLDSGETCPWQDAAGRCQARDARPMGCRVYFCDPAYEPHAGPLSESFIARLKTLVERFGLPWNYAPLHRHLAQARDSGRFADPPPAAAGNTDAALELALPHPAARFLS